MDSIENPFQIYYEINIDIFKKILLFARGKF